MAEKTRLQFPWYKKKLSSQPRLCSFVLTLFESGLLVCLYYLETMQSHCENSPGQLIKFGISISRLHKFKLMTFLRIFQSSKKALETKDPAPLARIWMQVISGACYCLGQLSCFYFPSLDQPIFQLTFG